MLRIASLTLVIGAVLLMTWVLAPASARQGRDGAVATQSAEPKAPTPSLDEVAADVARLRSRIGLDAGPFRTPARDPFRYGRSAAPSLPILAAPVAAPAPAPALPRLVAILSDTVNGAIVRRAAVSVEGNVRIVSIGDAIGVLRVAAISADGIELADTAGAKFTVALRNP